MIELRDTKAEVGQSNWWLAVFMRHRLAWSILLAGWVRRQLGFVSLSHHVLRFHCVCDSWSFFLLFLICTFSVISLNSLTIWGIIVVVEQNRSQFLNKKSLFQQCWFSPIRRQKIHNILLYFKWPIEWLVFQLQILVSNKPAILKIITWST